MTIPRQVVVAPRLVAKGLQAELSARRHEQFVGRSHEKALFAEMVATDAHKVLFFCAPGGMGKTTLMQELLIESRERGLVATYVDCGAIEPTVDSIYAALGIKHGADTALRDVTQRRVLLFDTFEAALPLETWFRQVLLPSLPVSWVVVFAGREPPSVRWRTDLGWSERLLVRSLEMLSDQEAQQLLDRRSAPHQQQQDILRFASGHPLALALCADVVRQHPQARFDDAGALEVVLALVQQFMPCVPSEKHLAALEVCALVQTTTQSVLSFVLQESEAHPLFTWLSSLSFMRFVGSGLVPHDMARDALVRELKWRNPERFRKHLERCFAYCMERVTLGSESERAWAVVNAPFLGRLNPQVSALSRHLSALDPNIHPEVAASEDYAELVEIVRHWEGNAAAELARAWMLEQPSAVWTVRGAGDGGLRGLMIGLRVDVSAAEQTFDPVVVAYRETVLAEGPVDAQHILLLYRFWLDREHGHTVSPVNQALGLVQMRQIMTTQRLAYTAAVVPEAKYEPWHGHAEGADYHKLCAVPVGDEPYLVMGHDFRRVPVVSWFWRTALRSMGLDPGPMPPPPARCPISAEALDEALREALRDLRSPLLLSDNPLAATTFASEAAAQDASDRGAALAQSLADAIRSLGTTTKGVKAMRALERAYLATPATQEECARSLQLSLSSYRRHLEGGTLALIELLRTKVEVGAR